MIFQTFDRLVLRGFIFIFALLCENLLASEVINITEPGFNGRSFGKKSYSYVGDEPIETVSSAEFQDKFKRGANERHAFEMASSVFWVKIKLFNPLPRENKILILDSQNFPEEVSVYQNNVLLGSLTNLDSLRNRIIAVDFPPASIITLYIKRHSNGGQIQTWTYWNDEKNLLQEIAASERNWSFIMAIFAMSLLFNGMLFFAYRSRSYLYYASYLIAFAVLTTCSWSIFGSPYMDEITMLAGLVAAIAATLFTIHFLNLKSHSPRSYKILSLVISAFVLSILTIFLSPFFANRLTTVIVGLGAIAVISIAIQRFSKTRDIHVLLFIIAYGTFMLGSLGQMAIWSGLLPQIAGYDHVMFYAAALENVLMLLAIGYKVHSTNKQKNMHYKELTRLETLNSQIKTRALNSQMQPHFLFNSLAMIADYVRNEPDIAENSLFMLSNLYRRILESSNAYTWSLSKEVEAVKDYLDLQKLRFEERLDYSIECKPVEIEKIHCPSLILQTLVENSIKHGISQHLDGGKVELCIDKQDIGYLITITDSGSGEKLDIKQTGTGLANTRERLDIIYGPKSNFTIDQINGLTVVKFWISGEGYYNEGSHR